MTTSCPNLVNTTGEIAYVTIQIVDVKCFCSAKLTRSQFECQFGNEQTLMLLIQTAKMAGWMAE